MSTSNRQSCSDPAQAARAGQGLAWLVIACRSGPFRGGLLEPIAAGTTSVDNPHLLNLRGRFVGRHTVGPMLARMLLRNELGLNG